MDRELIQEVLFCHRLRFTISFGSDTIRIVSNWPIKTKFYVEPLWEGGTRVYINGPDHMTKMAAKNLQKSSYPESEVL